MALPHWPLFDLRIRTPRLELRPPGDDHLAALAALAAEGIHDPATTPFANAWTDAEVGGPLERSVYQFNWRTRAEWTPAKWQCGFVALCDGEVVGVQEIHATDYARMRVVETGSWLGLGHQGRGIGTEMRAAVLHLAFVGLGAQRALSGAWHDNAASLALSNRLGYIENGEEIKLRREEPDRIVNLLLTRERWEVNQFSGDIELCGLEPCLELFGAAPTAREDGSGWR